MQFFFVEAALRWWFRLAHWGMAISTIGLILTGWDIYNAAPFFAFNVLEYFALDLGLTEALRWHFFLAWALIVTLSVLLFAKLSGLGGAGSLVPVNPRSVFKELYLVVQLRLDHKDAGYLHVQRLAYLLAYGAFVLTALSGFLIWKPVQFQFLDFAFNDYETARRVHFWGMSFLSLFFVVHLTMALVVPRSLTAMALGALPERKEQS